MARKKYRRKPNGAEPSIEFEQSWAYWFQSLVQTANEYGQEKQRCEEAARLLRIAGKEEEATVLDRRAQELQEKIIQSMTGREVIRDEVWT
jgi:hypothetical protein